MHGEAAKERDGVFIGADGRGPGAGQDDVEFARGPASPAQGEVGTRLLLVDCHDHLFQQRAQELLALAVGRGRRRPDQAHVLAQDGQDSALFGTQRAGAATFASGELRLGSLQLTEPLLPLAFQAPDDQTVLRLHRPVAPLGAGGFVAGPFDLEPLRGERMS